MAKLTLLFVFIAFSLHSFSAVAAISRRPANIIEFDGRGMVSRIGGQYFTSDEIRQIRNSVGYVFCPGNPGVQGLKDGQAVTDDYLGPITTTGFLANEANVLVTSAHTFANARGEMRKNLKDCYFQPQGDNVRQKTQYKIVPGSLRHGFGWKDKDLNDDYAVVRLEARVENVPQPLMVLEDPAPMTTDMTLFPIVAFRPDAAPQSKDKRKEGVKSNGDLPHEPLVQVCNLKTLAVVANGQRPSTFDSDCDNERGGSGGPNLIRVGGRLTVIGIFSVTGPSIFNGQKYSPTPITVNGITNVSLSRTVVLDSRFLAALKDVIALARAATDPAFGAIGSKVPGVKPIEHLPPSN